MVKRRRTVIEELHEEEQLLVSGGEDFQTCLDLFLGGIFSPITLIFILKNGVGVSPLQSIIFGSCYG